jgi:hypothetical protein
MAFAAPVCNKLTVTQNNYMMYTLFHNNWLRTWKVRIEGLLLLQYSITVTESTVTKIKHVPQLLVKKPLYRS